MEGDHDPQERFVDPVPSPKPMNKRPSDDNQKALEYDINMALLDAEVASSKKPVQCRVGFAALKASFRR